MNVPAAPLPPIALIVLQPTSYCNLNCRYCYVPNRQDSTLMSDAVLEATIAKALRSPLVQDKIQFLFHAGEPLAAGLPFYQRACELITRHNTRGLAVTISLQTNATLITDAWCTFFTAQNVAIGVSVDGPQFLHDAHRRNWANRGSYAQVLRGIERLQQHGIEFGAICVLSRESLRYPEELLAFFVELQFASVGFNIEEIENVNTVSSMIPPDLSAFAQVEAEFREFLTRFLHVWEAQGRPLRIREFFDLALFMLRKQQNPGIRRIPDETADMGIITVQKNGDLSPYSPEFAGSPSTTYQNFVVGNILTCEYADILTNATYQQIQRDVHTSIALCASSCTYFDLCGGAFLSNKFWQNGTLLSTETATCKLTRQAVVDLLVDSWATTPMRAD